MKLLFDENISYRLPGLVAQDFPGSVHVTSCELLGSTDEEIWDYARDHQFVLVSKDSDFYQRVLVRGAPPKLVWLRLGNCTTSEVLALLIAHKTDVDALEDSTDDILILS